jgi:hypothetical protein
MEKQMIDNEHRKIRETYGFIANPNKSRLENAAIILSTMPSWYYFNKPHNTAFHDLTTTINTPTNLKSFLGLGLKFIPTPRYTTHNITDTIKRFTKDIFCKVYFKDNDKPDEEDDGDEYDKDFYVKSD